MNHDSRISNVGPDAHPVDIYLPQEYGVSPRPVIVYIHGGAWHIGDKIKGLDPCSALAEKGFVTVAASYSLSYVSNEQMQLTLGLIIVCMMGLSIAAETGKQMAILLGLLLVVVIVFAVLWSVQPRPVVQHPTHVQDVATTIRWIIDHIHEYQGDPSRIYLMGHSAGGHLAALLSTNDYYLRAVEVPFSTIKGCIGISGIYSDRRLTQTIPGQQLLTNTFGPRKHYYDAFPIYHVTPETPPFLLLNADFDLTMKRHTMDFHYSLKQEGIFSQVEYFPGKTHWNIIRDWGTTNSRVLDTIVQFIEEVEQVKSIDNIYPH